MKTSTPPVSPTTPCTASNAPWPHMAAVSATAKGCRVTSCTYNTRDRNRIINLNLRPVTHPYYSEYTALQKICLQILRHEALKYGQEKDRIYGVLFDGAWLWEEYLGTIFAKARLDITHAKNKTGENGIALYENGRKCYYPDFYRRNNCAETSFVLDAKYKRLGSDEKVDSQDDEKTK